MSWVGTAMGAPWAGDRMLWEASISVEASIWAFRRERDVNGHLVSVEIRVERGADQRVNADGLALDQHRLERLNARGARGSAVEQNGWS